MNGLKYFYLIIIIFFISCDTPVVYFPSEDNGPVIDSVFADGSIDSNNNVIAPTTKITFNFKDEQNGLQAGDIYLEAVFPFIKGELTEINKKTYILEIIPGKSGMIKASISPYTFTGWSNVSVQVYAEYDFEIYYENVLQKNFIRIVRYNMKKEQVEIPAKIGEYPVAMILSGVFRERNLASVIIPESVTTIHPSAFYGNNLIEIVIPDSVTYLGNSAFSYNRLENITFPENIIEIGTSTFGNNQLENIIIPEGIISLAGFDNNKLSSVIIPPNVEYIGESAFANNKIQSIIIPEKVKTIRTYAFAYNLIKEIEFPPGITEAGGFNDNKITDIELPESVINIGAYAFANNQINNNKFYNELIIPKKTEYIGMYAFANNQLQKITFDDEINLIAIGEGAFQNNQLTDVTIPDNVTLYRYAFTGNELASITVGEGVELTGIVFGNGFEVAYNSNNKSKGTYLYDADVNIWTKQPE